MSVMWVRWYSHCFREEKENIESREYLISILINATGKSKNNVLSEALDMGIEKMLKDPEFAKYSGDLDLALAIEMKEIRRQEARDSQFERIYERSGADGIMDFCATNEQTEAGLQFLVRHAHRVDREESWSSRTGKVLEEWLSDGLDHYATDMRQKAMNAGIIDESSKDWAKLRMLASRRGYTKGKKGCWRFV